MLHSDKLSVIFYRTNIRCPNTTPVLITLFWRGFASLFLSLSSSCLLARQLARQLAGQLARQLSLQAAQTPWKHPVSHTDSYHLFVFWWLMFESDSLIFECHSVFSTRRDRTKTPSVFLQECRGNVLEVWSPFLSHLCWFRAALSIWLKSHSHTIQTKVNSDIMKEVLILHLKPTRRRVEEFTTLQGHDSSSCKDQVQNFIHKHEFIRRGRC